MIKKIIVDCEPNDIIDIKCGGPRFLGYDFFCKEEDLNEITSFIKEKLNEYNQPLYDIRYSTASEEVKIWSKEEIDKCIKDGY